MKISINKTFQITPTVNGEKCSPPNWGYFNGSFQNKNLPIEQIKKAVMSGYTYTAQHKNYRDSDNFIAGQHVDLDFDGTMTLDTLLANGFIANNAAFIYETRSHTDYDPRYRVFFAMETFTSKVDVYKDLRLALLAMFPSADKNHSDVARISYGCIGCKIYGIGNVLSVSTIRQLVIDFRATKPDKPLTAIRNNLQDKPYYTQEFLDNRLQWNLEKITNARAGEKHITRLKVATFLGGAVAGGFYPEMVFNQLLDVAMAHSDGRTTKKTIEDAFKYGKSKPIYQL